MRVEGQGMAVDYSSAKNDAVTNKLPGEKAQESRVNDKLTAADLKNYHQVKEDELEIAAGVMNEAMKISNYHLQFRVHKDSGRIQVKVIDSDTDKVLREIPPENVLECSAKIKEMLDHMAGIIVDEKV